MILFCLQTSEGSWPLFEHQCFHSKMPLVAIIPSQALMQDFSHTSSIWCQFKGSQWIHQHLAGSFEVGREKSFTRQALTLISSLHSTTPLDPVNCQRIKAERDERSAHQSCFGRLIEQPRNKYKNVFVNNFDFLDEHWTVEKSNVLPVYWSPTKNQGVCLFLRPIFI